MNRKKSTFLAVAALASCLAIGTVTFAAVGPVGNGGIVAGATTYGFTLNGANATVTDGEVVATATGNTVALAFTGATESAGNFCALATGGTISNTREVLGVSKMTVNFTGAVKVYAGAVKGHWTTIQSLTESGEVVMTKSANYFKIEATADTTVASVEATYVCEEADPEGVTHTASDKFTVVENGDSVSVTKVCTVCGEPVGTSYPYAKPSFAAGNWNYKDGTYGFEADADGWYTSTNHNKNNSTAKATFTVTTAGTLKFDWESHGEGSGSSWWDYFEVKVNSASVVKKQIGSGSYEGQVAVNDVVTFTYTKDSSTSNEPDCAKFKVVAGELTYCAVTFNTMEGDEVAPALAVNGKVSTLPTPTREGYTFLGWYKESTYNTKVDVETVYADDTMIYAKWFDNSQTHPLAGAYKGWYLKPYTSTTSNYSSGKTLTVAATGEMTGDLTGTIDSYAEATGLGEAGNYNIINSEDAGAVIFVPKTGYIDGFYVFYKGATNTSSSKGYSFALNNDEQNKYLYLEVTKPDSSKNYMFIDLKTNEVHYDITVVDMSGKAPSSVTSFSTPYGYKFSAPGMTDVKIGYNSSDYKWYPADEKFGAYKLADAETATLFVNGVNCFYEGSTSGTRYTYVEGDTANEIVYTNSTTTSNGYVLDFANKTYVKAAKTITVSFDMGGHGEQAEPLTKGWDCWVYASDLPKPTAEGLAFVGWFTDPGCTIAYVQTKYKTNVTLYAKWAAAKTITLVLNNGQPDKTISIPQGNTPSLETPIRDGYMFKGWYTDEGLNTPYVPGPVENDFTVYAKWELLPAIVGSYFGYNFDGYGNETSTSALTRTMTVENGSIVGAGTFSWDDYDEETGLLANIGNAKNQIQFLKAADGTMFAVRGYSLQPTPYSSTDMDVYVKAASAPASSIGTFAFTPGATSTGRYVKMIYWTMGENTYKLWIDTQKGVSYVDVTFEDGEGNELENYSDFYSGSIKHEILVVKDSAGEVIATYTRNGTQYLSELDGYQGTYTGSIYGEAATITLNGGGSAQVTIGTGDAANGTYTIAEGVFNVKVGTETYQVTVDKDAGTFTQLADGYEGTYTGPDGDLVLDGYRGCTLAGETGTYVVTGTAITVTVGETATSYEINKEAKTYATLSEWAGRKVVGTWESEWDEGTNTITVEFGSTSAITGTLKSNGHYTKVDCTFTAEIEGDTMTMTIVTGSVSYLSAGKHMVWTIGTNASGDITLTAVSNDIGKGATEQFGYPVGLVLTLA
ncbi:MAG: InlB B-repeat-containing protein [Bacilli bacterium]|nr:InlB B-repeat-containing protein [Bacilli bacterium]